MYVYALSTEEAVSSTLKLASKLIAAQVSCQVWGSAVGTLCVACWIQETEAGFLSLPYVVKIWQLGALPMLQNNGFFFVFFFRKAQSLCINYCVTDSTTVTLLLILN